MKWVRRRTMPKNPSIFELSVPLTIDLALARFRGPKMAESVSPLHVRRRYVVEAATQKEAIAIVLRNMRESLEAEGFKVRAITTERVEERT